MSKFTQFIEYIYKSISELKLNVKAFIVFSPVVIVWIVFFFFFPLDITGELNEPAPALDPTETDIETKAGKTTEAEVGKTTEAEVGKTTEAEVRKTSPWLLFIAVVQLGVTLTLKYLFPDAYPPSE